MRCGWWFGGGISLTLIGVALGLAASLALTRIMKNLLFEGERDRSGDLRSDRLAADRRRSDCELHSGAARDECRSATSPSPRLMRVLSTPHAAPIHPARLDSEAFNAKDP